MDADELRALADELAIRNLLNRFAQLSDEGDLDEYRTLITDDAVWEGPRGPGNQFEFQARKGHEDILAGVRQRMEDGIQGPGTDTHHVILNTVVRLDGDTATARSYYLYFENTQKTPVARTMGTYDDRFRRTEAGWKLSHRTLTPG